MFHPRISAMLLLVMAACACVILSSNRMLQMRHLTPASISSVFTGDLNLKDNKSICRNNSECSRFHRLIDQEWPIGKPRGVVVMLISRRVLRTKRFITFAKNFDKFFNDAFKYPLILFHDRNIDESAQKLLRSWTNSSLFFQEVNFVTPQGINESQVTDHCFGGISSHPMAYRNMCRFLAKGILAEPILASQKLEYVLRLDDDSVFTKPINYDIFGVMSSRQLQYGYAKINDDVPDCVVGLEEAVQHYFNRKGMHQKIPWKMPQQYYNNFELSDIKLWRSADYTQYINYIDVLGGIYKYRWGDAPIKSLFVSFLVEKNSTHHFSDIGYFHEWAVKVQEHSV